MTQMQDLLQKLADAQVLVAEANKISVTVAQENRRAIEENTKEVSALSHAIVLHITQQERFERMVNNHELILHGTEDKKGLMEKFNIIEDKVMSTFGGFSRAAWIAVGVTVTAFVVWFWQTFGAGLMKP